MVESRKRKHATAVVALLLAAGSQRSGERKRRWVKKYRNQFNHSPLIKELWENYPDDYKNYLRLDSVSFDALLDLVKDKIHKNDTVMRKAITAEQRLTATLRYLATGRSYEDLKFTTGISAPSLSNIIPETCKVLYDVLRTEYMKVRKISNVYLYTVYYLRKSTKVY
jgi:hypothetical protein